MDQSSLCYDSSFKLIDNGVIPLCFMDMVLYGANTLFIFIMGIWRIKELRLSPRVDIPWIKATKAKIGVTMCIALLHLIRSFFHVFSGTGRIYSIVSDFYIVLGWIFSIYLVYAEYSRGLRNNWILRVWWTTSFFLYSLTLQTTIELFQNGKDIMFDLLFSIITEIGSIFLVVVGLFFNRISESYQPVIEESQEEDVFHFDKKSNPEQNANFWSMLFFSWLNPLLWMGYKRPLEDSDLYELPNDHKANYLANRLGEKWDFERMKQKPSLIKATWRAFGRGFLRAGLFKLVSDILTFAGPIILQRLIAFVASSNEPNYIGYLYAFGLSASASLQSIFIHRYFWNGYRVGMMVLSWELWELITDKSSFSCTRL